MIKRYGQPISTLQYFPHSSINLLQPQGTDIKKAFPISSHLYGISLMLRPPFFSCKIWIGMWTCNTCLHNRHLSVGYRKEHWKILISEQYLHILVMAHSRKCPLKQASPTFFLSLKEWWCHNQFLKKKTSFCETDPVIYPPNKYQLQNCIQNFFYLLLRLHGC